MTTDIGSGVTGIAGCPKEMKVTLEGAGAAWELIKSVSTLIKSPILEASDGYLIKFDATAMAVATIVTYGGCVSTDKGSKGKLVCIRGGLASAYLSSMTVGWVTETTFKAATAAWTAHTLMPASVGGFGSVNCSAAANTSVAGCNANIFTVGNASEGRLTYQYY